MKDFIKKYYLNMILVLIYTGMAMTVYIIWFDSLWHLWYVDFITAVVIAIAGGILGYMYIRSEMKNKEPEKYGNKKVEESTEGDEKSGE